MDQTSHATKVAVSGNKRYAYTYTGLYPNTTLYAQTTSEAFGDGARFTDARGNVFTTQADMLGRPLSSTNPVSGTWRYAYDDTKNTVTQTDANNQTITSQLDALNRISKKTYPDGSAVKYYYDETGHGSSKGRLTRVASPGWEESYTYDARGRVTDATHTIDGISKVDHMAYI